MRPFDKFFKRVEKSTKKIKIKMIQGKESPEEHEKFLKPDDSMTVKVSPDRNAEATPAPKRKSNVIKVTKSNTEEKKSPSKPKTVVRFSSPDGKLKNENAEEKSKQILESPIAPVKNTKTVSLTKNDDKKNSSSKAKKEPKVKADVKSSVSVTEDDSYTKDAVTVKEGSTTRNGKFDIQRAKDGRFFFNLYASNHTVIAYSQIYSSTTAAMTGIKSIIANAESAPIEDTTLKKTVTLPFPKWEIYIDKAGEYRFRLYATNGLQICHSAHGYATKSGCKGGIESIGRFASDAAKIDKSYLK